MARPLVHLLLNQHWACQFFCFTIVPSHSTDKLNAKLKGCTRPSASYQVAISDHSLFRIGIAWWINYQLNIIAKRVTLNDSKNYHDFKINFHNMYLMRLPTKRADDTGSFHFYNNDTNNYCYVHIKQCKKIIFTIQFIFHRWMWCNSLSFCNSMSMKGCWSYETNENKALKC